jgi:transposase
MHASLAPEPPFHERTIGQRSTSEIRTRPCVLERPVPKSKPPYPPEFRREALELIRISDKPIAQTAKDLGVTDQTLRNWKRQAEIDAGKAEGLTTDERAELRELRRRVRTLEMEREVLKKAAAFFARESEGR